MKWNSKLYDDAQGFVSEYGKGLISFIPDIAHQTILDLGCGTGDLTAEISKNIAVAIQGVDASPEMITQAKEKYPHLDFSVCDACTLPFESQFDVIFSNAVFHWIQNQTRLHQSIFGALKAGGLLICEFGGYENIFNISQAFSKAVAQYKDTYTSPFYFPKAKDHQQVLIEAGFSIEKIYDYDRPTPLPNGEEGLRQWVQQFFSSDLQRYDTKQQDQILTTMEQDLHSTMFDGTQWIADYRRLRVIAHKPL